MPVDPDIQKILDVANSTPVSMSTDSSIEDRREGFAEFLKTVMIEDHVEGVASSDTVVPSDGHDIPIRIYRPDSREDGSPAPVIVYLHGGSWLVGSISTHDAVCRRISKNTNSVVVSVEYRLAPEHPFPAGFEDAWHVLTWVRENAKDLGADPTKIVVGGDSAGGNFGLALSVRARDEGFPLAAQLLIYPSSDLSKRYPAMDTYGKGYFLEIPSSGFLDKEYLVHEELTADKRVSPLLYDSYVGLAPAVVYTAEFDPIKEHGEAAVAKLKKDGVRVIHRESPGMIHGFIHAGSSPAAMSEIDRMSADILSMLP